jgi:Flp pilus assembly pilin Flp
MMNLVRRFIREENGEDLIEYGLLAAFVASVALVVILNDALGLRSSIRKVYQFTADAIDGEAAPRLP